MNRVIHRFVPIFIAGVVGLGARQTWAGPPATQPSMQDLMEQIYALQNQVTELKTQQSRLQQDQVQDNGATMKEVVEEADQHSRLFDVSTPSNAGWNSDRGLFYIQSDDGKFLLHPGIIFQFRYIANNRSRPSGNTDGFEVKNMKFDFDGNIFTKDLTYKFQ